MKIIHLALVSLIVLSMPVGKTISQTIRDHRTPSANVVGPLSDSEAAAFQRRIRMLERRAGSAASELESIKSDTSSLYGSVQKQVHTRPNGAFGGTLGATEGTGFVSCTQACETEHSKCGSSFLCDIQGAKCLLKCAVD